MVASKSATSTASFRLQNYAERLCQTLLVVTLVGVLYRFCWIGRRTAVKTSYNKADVLADGDDSYKCGALLHKGDWLDAEPTSSGAQFQNWQPPGCMLHEYKSRDIKDCLGWRRLVFFGDSTTRQIFWAVAKKLDRVGAEELAAQALDHNKQHQDINFESGHVELQFFWDPWLNSTNLKGELDSFSISSVPMRNGTSVESAAMVLLGSPGLWYARNGEENYVKGFRSAIDRVIPFMDNGSYNSSLMLNIGDSRRPSSNLLLLAPIQVPHYPSLSPPRESTITPEKIDQMNDYLQQASAFSGADVVWSYSLMTWAGPGTYQKDGLHVIDSVADRKADILLNARCNNEASSRGPPFDRTCCSSYKRKTGVQWGLLLTCLVIFPALALLGHKNRIPSPEQLLPSDESLTALAIIGLISSLCFFSDRTPLFEKSQRQYRPRDLCVVCLVIVFVGLGSIRRSRGTTSNKTSSESGSVTFLSRDQTDEWKGWMQAIVLVYHFIYGSRTLWLYEIIRVLVASYLFMTGFGHSIYFLEKNDYSFRRVLSTLLRLNMLSCLLPYIMGTDYMFYYFAPLVSYWFLVVYATFRVGHERNSDAAFLLRKIMLSCALTTAAAMIPGVWNSVFDALSYTCAIHWDAQEWQFRNFLDMYIVYVGMLLAVISHRVSKIHQGLLTPTSGLDIALKTMTVNSWLVEIAICLLSLCSAIIWFAAVQNFAVKEDYNQYQPYISFIPILSFIAVRNCCQIFRNHYSAALAWLGRCSLEIFVLQYHIWLAADTKGLLRIGLWDDKVQTAVLTIIFLYISKQMADATQVVTVWIVGGPTTESRKRASSTVRTEKVLPLDEKPDRFQQNKKSGVSLRRRLGMIVFGLWSANVLSARGA